MAVVSASPVELRRESESTDREIAAFLASLTPPERRVYDAADELFDAIAVFAKLTGSEEYALDELINCSFNPTMEAPKRPNIDPARLSTARDRLRKAGIVWAAAVIQSDDDAWDQLVGASC